MRSRLYNHKQHENNRKIISMLIFIILLTVFMITIGFRLLINTVVFINNTFNPDQETLDEDVNGDDFYGSISLEEPPTATNSASIYLSGTTQDYELVDIYINNTKVESVTVKGNNSFHKRVGKLKEGDNQIYVIARTGNNKQSKQTDIYTVYYKKEPLKLEIEQPTDGMQTTDGEIQVSGVTDPDSTLKLNGHPVVIDFQGKFNTSFRLKEGENMLAFSAEDIAGNKEEVEIKVTLEKDD